MKISPVLHSKISQVKAVVLDVDGVLTSGYIVLDHEGNEIKVFDVQDGFGIVLLKRSGYRTGIISARASDALKHRAVDLGIEEIFQNAHPKTKALDELCETFDITAGQVCFVGDDLTDLGVFQRVGCAVAVANAREDIKAVADYITRAEGGRGAVREVAELILKTTGQWQKLVDSFSQ